MALFRIEVIEICSSQGHGRINLRTGSDDLGFLDYSQ